MGLSVFLSSNHAQFTNTILETLDTQAISEPKTFKDIERQPYHFIRELFYGKYVS